MAFVVASGAVGDLVRAAPRRARVTAALAAAVYLQVPAGPGGDAAWVALLARDAVRVPIGLVTAVARDRAPFEGIEVGDGATIGAGALRLADGREYRPLRYWDPGVPLLRRVLAGTTAVRRVEALAQLAAALRPEEVRDWTQRIEPLARALRPAGPDVGRVAEAVLGLTGLGPGLTPAGDDVLAGALVTLAAAGDEGRRGALVRAVRAALGRTTPISAALLDQACRGRAVPEVAAVLRAVTGSGDLDLALAGLAGVGHTSGAALGLGIRAAVRAAGAPSVRPLRRCA